ncbi:MAG: hypothetical protein GX992_09675 [Clostridium sp.]|nr:hypothetical protein [Clostridium sp.]
MFDILKNKRGMTLYEVVISIGVFAVIAVPLVMLFNNSVIMANKNKAKIDLNSATAIIVEEVKEAVKDRSNLPKYSSYNPVSNNYTGYEVSLTTLLGDAISGADGSHTFITEKLGLMGPNGPEELHRSISYTVKYDHENYYDPKYPDTYNFLITVFEGDKNIKNLKIAVWRKDSP